MNIKKTVNGCCFLAGINVVLPGGRTTISAIQVGQAVMSYDLKKSKAVSGKVLRMDVDSEPTILKIGFENGDLLICTPSQRLLNDNRWMLAGELKAGTKLSGLVCESVERKEWQKAVFTLVVEPWNNYIVLSKKGVELVAHDNSSDLGYPPGFEQKD